MPSTRRWSSHGLAQTLRRSPGYRPRRVAAPWLAAEMRMAIESSSSLLGLISVIERRISRPRCVSLRARAPAASWTRACYTTLRPLTFLIRCGRFPEPAGHPLGRLFGSHRLLRLRAARRCIQRLLPGNTPGCSRTEASAKEAWAWAWPGRPALLFGLSADGRSFGSRRSSTVVKATATLDRACHASMLHVACHRPSVHGVHVAAAVPQHGRQGVDHRRASRTAPPPQGRRGSLGPRLGERPPVRLNVPTWPVACSRRYGACCVLPRNTNNTP